MVEKYLKVFQKAPFNPHTSIEYRSSENRILFSGGSYVRCTAMLQKRCRCTFSSSKTRGCMAWAYL